jgi:hypothetical protein
MELDQIPLALGFAALNFSILMLPIYTVSPHGRYYGLSVVAAWIIAALNFIWFILVCRRWRLPEGRTSLQADRDEHQDHWLSPVSHFYPAPALTETQ